MEYKYQNSIDDFRVKYTLIVPDGDTTGYQLAEKEQAFLDELENAYADIERLTNQADGYDYALAVSSGIIAGLIDSFFVGKWDFKKAKDETHQKINKMIVDFAKKDPRYIPWCNGVGKSAKWIKRDPERLASAVEYLEETYVLPGDNEWKFKDSGIWAKTHRLDDFCHHPTLIGMICCILVQFTGTITYYPSKGDAISMPVTVNEYGNFVSDKPLGKVFAGIINWFFVAAKTLQNQKGHLMSDIAGSFKSAKRKTEGAGIPGTVMSTLKELSTLPCFQETDFAEKLRRAYQNGIGKGGSKLDLGVFNSLFEGASSKVDMRTEMAVKHELKRQQIPIIINEIVVRSFYFVRRFIEQMRLKQSILDLEWKKVLPVNNRTIVRMMTVASGTFFCFDLGDAVIRAGFESGGEQGVFWSRFILRVNFVGIGRFTLAVGADLYMEARKGRLEIAVSSGEVAAAAIDAKRVIVETASINQETTNRIEKMKSVVTDVEHLVF